MVENAYPEGICQRQQDNREAVLENNPGLKPISAKISKWPVQAENWWGEAPELPQRSSKATEVGPRYELERPKSCRAAVLRVAMSMMN
jgi:hypothetical protein